MVLISAIDWETCIVLNFNMLNGKDHMYADQLNPADVPAWSL